MKQKTTISDLILKIIKMENDIHSHDLQLDRPMDKTIGIYLEEIISWIMVIVFMVGIIVGLGWTIHFTYEFIKRLV